MELKKKFSAIPPAAVLTAILLGGFLLRLMRRLLDPLISRDGAGYLEMAHEWALTGDPAAAWKLDEAQNLLAAPLFVRCIAWLEQLGLSPEKGAVAFNILLGTATVYLFYQIGKELFEKEKYALVLALCVAVHPALVRQSAEILRENLYFFCFSGALFFLLRLIGKRGGRLRSYLPDALAAGALAAAACYTRMEAGELLLALCAWALCRTASFAAAWKKTLLFAASLVVSFFLLGEISGFPSGLLLRLTHQSFMSKVVHRPERNQIP